MTGWIGDFFRFWWALFYWNTRKGWFRLRGAHRDDCPCQNASDSGLALETRCEAVVHWSQPARFRRVCPLLKETPDGWRCTVEAERVRPFWGRAALHAAALLLALYLAGTVVVFIGLRAAKYDMSYLAVVWPPRWKDLRGAQEHLYSVRAQQALAHGNYQEAMLSLEMVCQINPYNYNAGLALAGLAQVAAQPYVSEHVYERLMRDVPDKRIQTAQIWFRILLARSAYDKIIPLAGAMLSEDPEQRGAWLNALLFAARQGRDAAALRDILQQNPHLPEWCTELIALELAMLENRPDSALDRLTHVQHDVASSYVPYYQVEQLVHLGHPDTADSVLTAYSSRLPPDEVSFLRLRIYQARHWTSLVGPEFDNLLQYPLNARHWTSLVGPEFDNLLQYPMSARLAAKFCAYLIAYPAPGPAAGYVGKFLQSGPAISAETIPLYHASYLVAALAGDAARAERLRAMITKFTSSDARVLNGLVELLQDNRPDPRMSRILPLVPLPAEVVYAILERTPAAAAK